MPRKTIRKKAASHSKYTYSTSSRLRFLRYNRSACFRFPARDLISLSCVRTSCNNYRRSFLLLLSTKNCSQQCQLYIFQHRKIFYYIKVLKYRGNIVFSVPFPITFGIVRSFFSVKIQLAFFVCIVGAYDIKSVLFPEPLSPSIVTNSL